MYLLSLRRGQVSTDGTLKVACVDLLRLLSMCDLFFNCSGVVLSGNSKKPDKRFDKLHENLCIL